MNPFIFIIGPIVIALFFGVLATIYDSLLNHRKGTKYRIVSRGHKYLIQNYHRGLFTWCDHHSYDNFLDAKRSLESMALSEKNRLFNKFSKEIVVATVNDLTPDQKSNEIINILSDEISNK